MLKNGFLNFKKVDSTRALSDRHQTALNKMADNRARNMRLQCIQNNYWTRHFAAKAVCDAALAVATTPEQREAAYAVFDAERALASQELRREMARLR